MTTATPDRTTAGLRPPTQEVDPRCRSWWLWQGLLWTVWPAITLFVLGLLISDARSVLIILAALALVLAVALSFGLSRLRYAIRRWEVTDQAVYSRQGWLWVEWRAAPLSRVQSVDMTRGPIQRAFGLASVTVTTASSKGAVTISALDAAEAEELVLRLTPLTEGHALDRDAT